LRHTFCEKCASRLTDREIGGAKRQVCPQCGSIVYEHSRPCAGALVVDRGCVLLVKRAVDPFKGYWDIPGGFLEAGEHPAAGAARELLEETGLSIEPIEVVGLFVDEYGADKIPTLSIVYHARVKSGTARAASDASEVRWFALDQLPDKLAFPWSRQAIDALIRILQDRSTRH